MVNSRETSSDNLLLLYTISCVGSGFGLGIGAYGTIFSLLNEVYYLAALFLGFGVASLIASVYMYSEMSSEQTNSEDMEEIESGEDTPAIPAETDSEDEENVEEVDLTEGEDPEEVDEIINADEF